MSTVPPQPACRESPIAAAWPRHRLVASAGTRSYSQPWSCFRGPKYGVSPWDNVPVAWDGPSGQGVLWKTPLKTSCVSSPVLWQDRIFLTEADENERAVLAFDAESGRELWRQVVADGGKDAPLPPVADSGLALPTPACDADGVYVLFGTGDLAAFTHDGRPKWQIFLKRPEIGYGYASSPCVIDGLVCVQFDEINGGRVLAVEAATGKIKWEHPRSRGPSWSSPIVDPRRGRQAAAGRQRQRIGHRLRPGRQSGVGRGRRQRPGDAFARLVGRPGLSRQCRLAADLLQRLRQSARSCGN